MNYSMLARFYNTDWERVKKRSIIFGTVIFVIVLVSLLLFFTLKPSAVFCDGEEKTVYTFSQNTERIISLSGFTKREKDRVIESYNEEEKMKVVSIAKEHRVLVYDEDNFVSSFKITGTVKEALKKAGVKLRKGDEINFPLDEGITKDICIKVKRGFKVKINFDGKSKTMYFCGGTVDELLEKADVKVSDNDFTKPKRKTKITSPAEITLHRVTYEYSKVKSDIPFETKITYDENKFEDEIKVKKKGKNGKKEETVRKVFVDGEYEKTETVKTEILKDPLSKEIIKGKKQRPSGYKNGYVNGSRVFSELQPPMKIELDENNRPVKYKRVITGKATAYCTGTTTSTGQKAMPGRVAVDPREIPYGTKMYIVSCDGRYNYGYSVASDTGGFIYNSSTVVDLYMRSYNDCINFGRRSVDIYILE